MKANELMIGDWVVYDGDVEYTNPIKVEGIDIATGALVTSDREDVGIDNIQPIPLTGEILEKNGFYASEVSSHHIKYVCSTGPIDEFADIVLICGKDNKGKWHWDCLELRIHYYRGDIHQFKINYVHELQHAVRLCGIEKDFEL
jgi:hypothetical protein